MATPQSTPSSALPTGPSQPTDADAFDDALRSIAGVQGWLTDGQARRLWDGARRLARGARIVEIGSYRGRSTILLAIAAPEGAEVVAIDPHAGNDRGPQQIYGSDEQGESDHRAFRANLDRAGVTEHVRHIRLPSGEAIDRVEGQVDVVYIDGAHRYRRTEHPPPSITAAAAAGGDRE